MRYIIFSRKFTYSYRDIIVIMSHILIRRNWNKIRLTPSKYGQQNFITIFPSSKKIYSKAFLNADFTMMTSDLKLHKWIRSHHCKIHSHWRNIEYTFLRIVAFIACVGWKLLFSSSNHSIMVLKKWRRWQMNNSRCKFNAKCDTLINFLMIKACHP